VVIEYAPMASAENDGRNAPRQLEFDTSGFVQMELQGLDTRDDG
jgi:hypothetical protein